MAPDTLPALPGNGVHYLVTVTWRGRMHIDPLRVFAREGDARPHAVPPTGARAWTSSTSTK